MKPRTITGIVLVALGVLALVYQGINYTSKSDTIDIGPRSAQPGGNLVATGTPEDIAAMREAADMPPVDISRSETFEAYCQANARFHLLVVRSTGNSLFEGIVMAALDHFQIPAYLGFGPQTDSNNPSQRHHELVDAIEARDEAKAHAIMSQHVISGGDRILTALIDAGY